MSFRLISVALAAAIADYCLGNSFAHALAIAPALIGGAMSLAGGILGGEEQEVKYSPGQIAAGNLMQSIGKGNLDYVGPQGITNNALAGAEGMDMDISPALQYTQQVLSGDFMGGNPYLDENFDRAAGQVRNQLDTQFAKAGRYGAGAHEAAAGDAYNNLASDMYGNAYNQERAYMDSAAARLPQIQGAGINNVQGLLGVGQVQDQYADESENWDVYEKARRLEMMQAGQGMMPQPTYQNRGAGALGGALGGLQLFSGIKGLMSE